MFGQLFSKLIFNSKSRVTMIIMNNCDANRFILLITEMGFKTRVFIHQSFERYDQRCISRARIVECCLWHMFTIITWIRLILPVIVPKRWVIGLVSSPAIFMFPKNTAIDDPNMRMAHLAAATTALVIFILLLILQIKELNYTNILYKFFNNYLKKNGFASQSQN